jgi:mono/diheme cytochrome c family protein
MMWEQRNVSRLLVVKPGEKPRHDWVDNIKMDFREIGWGGMDLFELTVDRDQWMALAKAVMNLWAP